MLQEKRNFQTELQKHEKEMQREVLDEECTFKPKLVSKSSERLIRGRNGSVTSMPQAATLASESSQSLGQTQALPQNVRQLHSPQHCSIEHEK